MKTSKISVFLYLDITLYLINSVMIQLQTDCKHEGYHVDKEQTGFRSVWICANSFPPLSVFVLS